VEKLADGSTWEGPSHPMHRLSMHPVYRWIGTGQVPRPNSWASTSEGSVPFQNGLSTSALRTVCPLPHSRMVCPLPGRTLPGRTPGRVCPLPGPTSGAEWSVHFRGAVPEGSVHLQGAERSSGRVCPLPGRGRVCPLRERLSTSRAPTETDGNWPCTKQGSGCVRGVSGRERAWPDFRWPADRVLIACFVAS